MVFRFAYFDRHEQKCPPKYERKPIHLELIIMWCMRGGADKQKERGRSRRRRVGGTREVDLEPEPEDRSDRQPPSLLPFLPLFPPSCSQVPFRSHRTQLFNQFHNFTLSSALCTLAAADSSLFIQNERLLNCFWLYCLTVYPPSRGSFATCLLRFAYLGLCVTYLSSVFCIFFFFFFFFAKDVWTTCELIRKTKRNAFELMAKAAKKRKDKKEVVTKPVGWG